jgi:hypothetical protein
MVTRIQEEQENNALLYSELLNKILAAKIPVL